MTFWVAGATFVGTVGGAYLSSQGSQHAADAQAGASRDASQTQWDMYNQTRTDNMPALGARNDALARLEFMLGVGDGSGKAGYGSLNSPITLNDLSKDQGYQFGMNQGMSAIDNQMAARGMRDSGAAIKAAGRFGNDYATTKYDDAFNRAITNRQQRLNPLLSLAGAGQMGSQLIGQAGQNASNNISNNQIGAGNAQAANSIAQGNIWANAGNQLAGWYQNYSKGG